MARARSPSAAGGRSFGGRVLQVAGAVDGPGHKRGAVDGGGAVVVVADHELARARRLVAVGPGAVAREAVGGQHGALHQPGHDVVARVVRDLPAQGPGTEVPGPAERGGGHGAGALAVEVRAPAEPGQDPPLPRRRG